jgi:hypothetical protein
LFHFSHPEQNSCQHFTHSTIKINLLGHTHHPQATFTPVAQYVDTIPQLATKPIQLVNHNSLDPTSKHVCLKTFECRNRAVKIVARLLVNVPSCILNTIALRVAREVIFAEASNRDFNGGYLVERALGIGTLKNNV